MSSKLPAERLYLLVCDTTSLPERRSQDSTTEKNESSLLGDDNVDESVDILLRSALWLGVTGFHCLGKELDRLPALQGSSKFKNLCSATSKKVFFTMTAIDKFDKDRM